jgi:PAS domain S-box-containing protein
MSASSSTPLHPLEFQELANSMPQMVWTATADGSLNYFNDVWFAYCGADYEKNVGTGWTNFVHPEDLPLTAERWAASIQSGNSYTNEFRLKRKDGAFRWHMVRAYPIRNLSGTITKWIGTNTDIHESKMAAHALESEKIKFETLFADASTSMALLRGPDLIFEMANPSYQELFHHRIKIGFSIFEILPEIKNQIFAKVLLQVYETGVPYRDDEAIAFLRRSDNAPLEERYFKQSYTQLKDADGNPYGVYIHATEITVEVMARLQLEASRKRMNLAIEAAHMGTWHIDLKSMEVTTSKEFMDIFEFGFVGGNIFSEISRLMHPDDVDEVNRVWQAAVENKVPYVHEYRIVTSTGAVKWVHSRGQANYDPNGGPLTLSGILLDITDNKLAEERLSTLAQNLELAVATRDEFMSVASHELKTPLTSMSLQVQSMQRNIDRNVPDAMAPDRVKKIIANMGKQVNRLIRLVDDMLDISRIESGKLSINFEKFDLKDIIQDVVQDLRDQLQSYGCSITCELSKGAVGDFDRARIEQVLTNLITNAMKYGHDAPIEIFLTLKNSIATLQIRDHGLGIARENFEKVFQRFERIVSPNEVSGLGLGLFITREIVISHGGKIWLESELGEGTSFFVTLPL